MSRQPEIDPAVRALLEEIVADPRSCLRLAPKRALRAWFDGGETVPARWADATAAERHLITAHREAVAEMLCDAARIAYWKAPVLAHRPIEADGRPFDEVRAEAAWRSLAERRARFPGARPEDVALLFQCLEGIEADSAHALAQASLSLVPSHRARYFVALSLPWSRPRTAIALLSRLSIDAPAPAAASECLSSLAARLCAVERIIDARDTYVEASRKNPDLPTDVYYAFNLSCLLGDMAGALDASRHASVEHGPGNKEVQEARAILKTWWQARRVDERTSTRRLQTAILDRIPESFVALTEAIDP